MTSCIEKFPEYQTTQAEEYKQCQKQIANDAWDAKINVGEAELNSDEEAILNDYNKAITLTKEDETDAINFLNKKTTDIFKDAAYYVDGNTSTMVAPKIKKRSESEIKKYLEKSNYTYEDYLKFKETGNLPILTDDKIEEERNIIIKNKKRDFLENVDNDLRIGVEQKLIKQQDIAKKALDTNKFLQNKIVEVNKDGDLSGGELFDVSSEMNRMTYSLNKSRNKVKPQINTIQTRIDDAATFTNSEGEKITDINQKVAFLKNELDTNEDGTPKNTPSNKILINQINNSIRLYNTGAKKISELTLSSEPDAKFFEEYNNLAVKRDELVENYESLVNEQIAGMESNTSAMDAINVWKRSYQNVDQLMTATKGTINDVVLAGAEVSEFLTQAFRGVPGMVEYSMRASAPEIKSSSNLVNYFRSVRNQAIDGSAYLNNIRANKLPETIKLSDIRNSDDFMNYSMDAVMNNIPQTAMAFAGPAVATGWFTLSGLGNKAAEVGLLERKYQNIDFETLKNKYEAETDPFEKMFLESEIEAYDKAINTNQITKFLAFTTHGLAESIPARMFGSIKIAQGIKDVYKFVPKNAGAKFTKGVVSAFGAPVAESVEEGFTNTLQNLNARYMLGEDVSIFDNLDEAMAQGFIIGKGFSAMQVAPNVYGALLNVSQNKQDKKIIKNKTNELNQILDNLNNPDLNKNLTKKGAKQLKQKANALVSEIVTAGDVSLDKLSKLNFLEITTLGNVDKKMNNIQTRYVQAKKAGLQPKSLQIIKKDLQAEYDILQNQKASILGGETRTDQKLEEGQIVQEGEQIDTINNLAKSLNFAVKGAERLGINAETNLTPEQIKEKYGDEASQSAGFYDKKNNTLVINTEIALNTGSVTVGEHEMLHGILKTLPTDKLTTIQQGLQNSLNKDQQAVMNGIMNQVDKDGNKLYSDAYLETNPDEYIVQLSDAITKGDIKIEDSVITKIGDFIKQVFVDLGFKKLTFDSPSDVRLFLKNYQKSIKSGKLSEAVVQSVGKIDASDTTDVVNLNPQTPEGKKFQDEVQTLYTEGKIDEIIPKYRKSVTNNLLAEYPFLQNVTTEGDIAKRDAIIDDILNDPDRGVASVIFKYDKSRGVPLSGAIGSIITGGRAKRKRQYSEFVKKEFAPNVYEDSSDAAQRQAEQKLDDTSTKEDVIVESKKINPLKSNLTKGKITQIDSAVNIKPEEITTLTYKDVGKKFGNKVASEIFNVPVDKIADGTKNLTYAKKINPDGIPQASEAGNIQNAYTSKQDAKNFIKTLPPTNVTSETATIGNEIKDVSRNVQGTGIGLNKKMLDFFYQDTGKRSKGVTSQTAVKELKPKFKGEISIEAIIDFQNEMGITPAGTLNNYDRGIGQFLKGVAKAEGAKVANTVARQKVDKLDIKTAKPKSQIKADIAAGKSDLVFMFSPIQKVSKQFRDDLRDFQLASEIDLGNEFRKSGFELKSVDYVKSDGTIGRETRFIKDNSVAGKKFKKARATWIKSIASELHPSILEASLIAGGPRSMFGTLEDVYKALGVKTKAEAIKLFNKDAPLSPKNTIYSRGKNAKMTPAEFKAFTKTDAFKENEALKLPYLKHFATVMQNSILKDTSGDATAMWAGFMKSSDSMSSGIIRRNAPIKFFSNIAARIGNLFVEEHSMPSNNVAKYLFYSASQGKVDANFGFIKDNYFQGQLRKLDDKKMKGTYFNYIAKMPAAFFTMNNLTTWARYNNPDVNKNNGGIDFNTYQMIGTDVTVSQEMSKYKELAIQGQDVVLSNIKKDNVLENGKVYMKANPNSIPTLTDPKILNRDINQMIQDTKGIDAVKRFSDIVAKRRGAKVRNFKLISSGAQDFQGLMYDLYGRGKKGEQQQKWVQDNLIKPYQKGIADIDKYRQALKNDYATLLKQNPEVAKKLGKIIPGTEFTFDQALRVNLWTRAGFEIPGLSKRDIKILDDTVIKDPLLSLFNDSTLLISKRDKWVEPSAYWDSESLISDLNNLTNKVGRKQYLAEFIQNADVIFSKENLNKTEVALGTNWREAMEDSLYRMKNGTNRPSGTNKLTNQFNNWVNNSIGAIMFFNRKSALLQTISSVNFLNWSDNNPYKAALAFGNQPQYWSDFATLWNSPKLKQRRSGLRKAVSYTHLTLPTKRIV